MVSFENFSFKRKVENGTKNDSSSLKCLPDIMLTNYLYLVPDWSVYSVFSVINPVVLRHLWRLLSNIITCCIFRTIHLLLKNEQSIKRSREEVLKLNFVLYVFFELKSLKFTVKINFLKTQDLRSKVNFTKNLQRPKGTLDIMLHPWEFHLFT